MIEAVVAFHLSRRVVMKAKNAGGLMIVGSPGTLKTTIAEGLDAYPDALVMSDLNAQTLGNLKGDIAGGSIKTLVLPELQKVYERAEHTAYNVEGTLRALVSEGFAGAGWETQTLQRFRARCGLVACLTPTTYERHAKRWLDTGFGRRFCWALIEGDATKLEQAAIDDEWLDFGLRSIPAQPNDPIPNTTTRPERQRIAQLTKYQPGPHNEQIVILTRMLAALKWWYKEERRGERAMHTIITFGESLSRHGAHLDYGKPRKKGRR